LDKLHNHYFKECLLSTTEPKNVYQDKEEIEIEQEELENEEEYYQEEGEVDIKAGLIITLSEVKIERKKNKSLKEKLIKLKEGSHNPNENSEEVQHIIINLNLYLEEDKLIEETLKN